MENTTISELLETLPDGAGFLEETLNRMVKRGTVYTSQLRGDLQDPQGVERGRVGPHGGQCGRSHGYDLYQISKRHGYDFASQEIRVDNINIRCSSKTGENVSRRKMMRKFSDILKTHYVADASQ